MTRLSGAAVLDDAEVERRAEWRDAASVSVELMADMGRTFTTEELEEAGLGAPPAANGWQAVINTAAARGRVTVAGQRKARKPTRKGAWICVYQGIPKAAG